jgi:hypothetical protein
MRVASVTDQAQYTSVDVLISQPEIVIAKVTYSMSVVLVVDRVQYTIVDVLISLKAIVIARVTCSMSVAFVVDQGSQKENVIATVTY